MKKKFTFFTALLILLSGLTGMHAAGNSDVGAILYFDFEQEPFPVFDQRGGVSYQAPVVNPDPDEVNASENVGQFTTSTNDWGNIRYLLDTRFDFSEHKLFSLLVYHESLEGQIQIELGVSATGDRERLRMPYTTPGQWQLLVFELEDPQEHHDKYDWFGLFFANDRSDPDEVWYFDEFRAPPQITEDDEPVEPLFVWCDFETPEFTNVDGFRNPKGDGKTTATDVSGAGMTGGTAVRLDFEVNADQPVTGYDMWAFPPPGVNVNAYDEVVLHVRADSDLEGIRLVLRDDVTINAGSKHYFNATTQWKEVILPIEDFVIADGYAALSNLRILHLVEILFIHEVTSQSMGTLFIDFVGFQVAEEVVVPEPDEIDFVWCDFEDGFTNVGGFRETINSNTIAEDMAGSGMYEGTTTMLDYNLIQGEPPTGYRMWAWPDMINVSKYNELAIRIRADIAVENIRIVLRDDVSVGGGSAHYVNAGTDWQDIRIPLNDFGPADGFDTMADLSILHLIEILFVVGTTTPDMSTVYVDLVGFHGEADDDDDIEVVGADFVWADFEGEYSNVGGFREAVNGNTSATDVPGAGLGDGTAIELVYETSEEVPSTGYQMWAWPDMIDVSTYTHLVLHVKAMQETNNVRIVLRDDVAVGGGSAHYVDFQTGWQEIMLPLDDFVTATGYDNPADLGIIHLIQILFIDGTTAPEAGTIHLDLVGFWGEADDDDDDIDVVGADFVWADFESEFSNVGGFREALNDNTSATDVPGAGLEDGTAIELVYETSEEVPSTGYQMWAWPDMIDVSTYTHLVLHVKAMQETNNVRIVLRDDVALGGGSAQYVDFKTGWQEIMLPLDEFVTANGYDNPADLSIIHLIQILFIDGTTTPGAGTIHLDLVGFWGEADDDDDIDVVGADFVWADFESEFSNVGGFREALNDNTSATDVPGAGLGDGTAIELVYETSEEVPTTGYQMWAWPDMIDVSTYTHLVLHVKAMQETNNVRIVLRDDVAVGGGSAHYVDFETGWQEIMLPLDDFVTATGYDNPADLGIIHLIQILFIDGTTTPGAGTIHLDLVGFWGEADDVSVFEPGENKLGMYAYPNPARDMINVSISTPATILLVSSSGQIIKQKKTEGETTMFDLNGLPQGLYIIKALSNSASAATKIIVY